MNVRVEMVCVHADGTEQRREVLVIERSELPAMETLGMNLTEGKALLSALSRQCPILVLIPAQPVHCSQMQSPSFADHLPV